MVCLQAGKKGACQISLGREFQRCAMAIKRLFVIATNRITVESSTRREVRGQHNALCILELGVAPSWKQVKRPSLCLQRIPPLSSSFPEQECFTWIACQVSPFLLPVFLIPERTHVFAGKYYFNGMRRCSSANHLPPYCNA